MRSLGTAEQLLRTTATLAEGPRWDARRERLLWVDIEAGELHDFDPATGADSAVALGARVGCAAPIAGNRVLVALEDRLAEADLATGAVTTLAPIPGARPGLRMNDGACDPAGRLWFGSMADDEAPGAAALYRYDGETVDTVLTGVTLSNGLGWSPDHRTMYYVDSPTRRVDAFDYDPESGTVTLRRTLAAIEGGIPDGLAIDDEGGVWVALYGGGRVLRLTPEGDVDGVLEIPAENVTACCFAGRTLFVTTASGGGLYAAEAGVSGPPAVPFGTRSTAPSEADETQAR